jgi:hypothetical protein
MQLTADQELRRELLLFSLGKHQDIEAAIEMAAQMERFILEGGRASRGKAPATVPDKGCGSRHPGAGSPGTEGTSPGEAPAQEAVVAWPAVGGQPSPPPNGQDTSRLADDHRKSAGGTGKRRWSEADDGLLKRLWHSACSLEDIAVRLDRTTPSLYSRGRALGLPKRGSKLPEHSNSKAAAPSEEKAPAADNSVNDVHVNRIEPPIMLREPDAAVAGARRSDVKLERFYASRDGGAQSGKARRRVECSSASGLSGLPSIKSPHDGEVEMSVDTVIQFLRSRDYSVVHAGQGLYKLDGRRILGIDELREKANQVRKTLGQSPVALQPVGSTG